MKKNIYKLLSITLVMMMAAFGCTKKNTEEKTTAAPDTTAQVPVIERKSASSIDTLTSILVRSLKSKDKNLYVSYCFTTTQEEALAGTITDNRLKKRFQREFGFSLHEEVVYFENILKYIDKTKLDLNKIDVASIEVVDYNKSDYSPIVLKEVVLPIVQEGLERDIVYVAAQIDGKWYFTSELSL